MKKIIISVFIILLIMSLLSPIYTYAAKAEDKTEDKFEDKIGLGDLDKYKGSAKNPTKATAKIGRALGYIQIIGTVVSVVALILIGLKYMLGSVEEKAEYKKTLIPYIIGAFILFTGTLIPNLIYTFMQNF